MLDKKTHMTALVFTKTDWNLLMPLPHIQVTKERHKKN